MMKFFNRKEDSKCVLTCWNLFLWYYIKQLFVFTSHI